MLPEILLAKGAQTVGFKPILHASSVEGVPAEQVCQSLGRLGRILFQADRALIDRVALV